MTGVTVLPAVSFSGADGQDPLGKLIADAQGNLYGTTNGGGANGKGTVFEIPAGGNSIVALASFDGTDGWNIHSGLVMDSQGNFFGVAGQGGDNGNGCIFEVAAGSNTITKLASFNGTNGSNPWGSIVLDGQGNSI